MAESIRDLDPAVLVSVIERLKEGGKVVPKTPQEKQCYSILDQIEYVGGHVDGSITNKKYQRNEVWSLILFISTPQWFITISPV